MDDGPQDQAAVGPAGTEPGVTDGAATLADALLALGFEPGPGDDVHKAPRPDEQARLNQNENASVGDQTGPPAPDQPANPFTGAGGEWKQTSEGNCASIAALKGAMDHFGSDAFKSMTRNDDGSHSVEMRDGYQATVTEGRLEQARKSAAFERVGDTGKYDTKNFDPSNDPYDYAQLGYAAMAERNVHTGRTDDGQKMNYEQSLRDLGDGESLWSPVELGGWKNDITPVDTGQALPDSSVVANLGQSKDDGHAAFVNKDLRQAAKNPDDPNVEGAIRRLRAS